MGMLDFKQEDEIIKKKKLSDESLEALKKAKEGGVHGIAKAQKAASAAKEGLSSAVSKGEQFAGAKGGMDTAMKLQEGSKGLKLALNSKSMKGAGAVGSTALSAAGVGEDGPDAGSGAAQGLMAGLSTGNPYAAVAGAVIGGISGAIGAGEARKKKLAQIEAEKQKALGDIAERKAERLQSAFSNLGASLSGLF